MSNQVETIPHILTPFAFSNDAFDDADSFSDFGLQNPMEWMDIMQKEPSTLNTLQRLNRKRICMSERMKILLRKTAEYVKSVYLPYHQPFPQNNLFRHTIARNITMTKMSTKVAILFELAISYSIDALRECLTEGSIALLLPEKEQQDKPFAGALLGQVIQLGTIENRGHVTNAVAIQLLRTASVVDWSCSYTLAVYQKNESCLSVLSWLDSTINSYEEECFSLILALRLVIADDALTPNLFSTNENQTPDYIQNVEVDLACVLVGNKSFIANVGKNTWPDQNSQGVSVSFTRRSSLYTLSSSQISALKFALTHRIAVISGPEKSGKSFLAAKVGELIIQALQKQLDFRPVIIIAKSISGVKDIISHMPQVEPNPYHLPRPRKDPKRLQHEQICTQAKLSTLFSFRAQVLNHDTNIFCNVIPPSYADEMRKRYRNEYANVSQTITNYLLWNKWIAGVCDQSSNNISLSSSNNAQWKLTTENQSITDTSLMQIMDESTYQVRQTWFESYSITVSPIHNASNWPFPESTGLGVELRHELLQCWRLSSIENIWCIDEWEKEKVVDALTSVLIKYIDAEISLLMAKQADNASKIDELLMAKHTFFNKVKGAIGMTADFAANHYDWVSKLGCHVVIIDEASKIHESAVWPIIMDSAVQHVIIFANSESASEYATINGAST